MPTKDAQAFGRMDGSENRVEAEAFSKELDQRVDKGKWTKEQKNPPPVMVSGRKMIPQQEPKSVKDEVIVEDSSVETKIASDSELESESGESRLTKKPQTKQERLKKFMDSLESEFQIPPTRIVEAFNQLSPQELSLPADQSIDRVVNKLELEGVPAERVKVLYSDLIQDLVKIDASVAKASFSKAHNANAVSGLGAEVEPNMVALGLTQQRFDKVKTQRVALQKSLDQMNQNFWQPQIVPIMAQPMTPPLAQQPMMQSLVQPKLSSRDRSGLESYRDISLAAQGAIDAKTIDTDPLGFQQDREFLYDPNIQEAMALTAPPEVPIQPENDSELATPIMASNYNIERAPAMESLAKTSPMMTKLDSLANNPVDYSAALLGKLGAATASSPGSSDFFSNGEKQPESGKLQTTSKKTSGDDMKSMLATSLSASSELKDNSLSVAPLAAPLSGNEISSEVAGKNIQNIFQQAQYLVKNGGGEMKIKMTPEGLGEIQLNVELKDGRVQLLMVADNKETKKMLEANLSDLRESLSQQKIALDSVKIDSIMKTNVENQAQSGNQFGQNQNQDPRETRQFWNQFQEQFGGRPQREVLYEQPKAKGYAIKKSETIAPADTAAAGPSKGKSKGLNLVA